MKFTLSRANWKYLSLTSVILLPSLLSACSPYVYSEKIQALDTNIKTINTIYQDTPKKITIEKSLKSNLDLVLNHEQLIPDMPGCDVNYTGSKTCNIVKDNGTPYTPIPKNTLVVPLDTPPVGLCHSRAYSDLHGTSDTTKKLDVVDRAAVLKAISNYASALAAVTKAEDRKAFDSAASKLSDAVAGLAGKAALASGAGAAAAPAITALAKASSNMFLWFIGEGLDYQRLNELQDATEAACEPFHILASALEFILAEQRVERLDELSSLLNYKIIAVNSLNIYTEETQAKKNHKISKAEIQANAITNIMRGAAIEDAQTTADAFQAVRVTDPANIAAALEKTHDELVIAVRNNDGQLDNLTASLETFAQKTNDLVTAANSSTK